MVESYLKWMRDHKDKPWLVIGKGPSFDRFLDLPADHGFMVLGLNNVCTKRSVDATSILDKHVIEQTGDALSTDSKALFLPWHINVDCRTSSKSLPRFIEALPLLGRLHKQGKIFTYNSWLAHKLPRGPGPVVYLRYFGGVAGVGLLASAGVKYVRTLGIDGGKQYSDVFDKKNLFLNGRDSFDIQFREIDRIVRKHDIDFAVLEHGRRRV